MGGVPRVLDLAAAFNAAGLQAATWRPRLQPGGHRPRQRPHLRPPHRGGAPHLAAEHLAVFDCANRCSRYGKASSCPPHPHDGRRASFITGAISRPSTCPARRRWTTSTGRTSKLAAGLKAIAVSRWLQALPAPLDGDREEREDGEAREAGQGAAAPARPRSRRSPPLPPPRRAGRGAFSGAFLGAFSDGGPRRRAAPVARKAIRVPEAKISGHSCTCGPASTRTARWGRSSSACKEGAAFRSIMNYFAIAVSKGLQYGVPQGVRGHLHLHPFRLGRVEGHASLGMSTSILDYVFRALAIEYLGVGPGPREAGRADRVIPASRRCGKTVAQRRRPRLLHGRRPRFAAAEREGVKFSSNPPIEGQRALDASDGRRRSARSAGYHRAERLLLRVRELRAFDGMFVRKAGGSRLADDGRPDQRNSRSSSGNRSSTAAPAVGAGASARIRSMISFTLIEPASGRRRRTRRALGAVGRGRRAGMRLVGRISSR